MGGTGSTGARSRRRRCARARCSSTPSPATSWTASAARSATRSPWRTSCTASASVVQRELEMINESLDRYRIEVFNGHGRFIDAHTVGVCGPDGGVLTSLRGDVIVIATGSSPNRRPTCRSTASASSTARPILAPAADASLHDRARAGVIGVEFASIFAALGIEVTLVDTRDGCCPTSTARSWRSSSGSWAGSASTSSTTTATRRSSACPGDPPRVRCTLSRGGVLEADVAALLRRPRRQHEGPRPRGDRPAAQRATGCSR